MSVRHSIGGLSVEIMLRADAVGSAERDPRDPSYDC